MSQAIKTVKALTTAVPYGLKTLEGLMAQDGTFGIAVPQVAELFSFVKTNAQRDLKAILGKGFPFVKWKTDLNSKAVNVLTLEQFNQVAFELCLKGNVHAIEFMRDLSGMALTQLFSDAFNQKFEKEERQTYLATRQISKMARRTWTDAVKEYMERNDVDGLRAQFMYSNISDALNRGLFKKTAKALCQERGVDKNHLRDSYSVEELNKVIAVEEVAMYLVDKHNMGPVQAIKEALTSRSAQNYN